MQKEFEAIIASNLPEVEKVAKAYQWIINDQIAHSRNEIELLKALGDQENLVKEQIKLGMLEKLVLGNLDAVRDWGYAPDYVRAMWLMLQQDTPDDFVVATGETHSVKEFLESVFNKLDLFKDEMSVVEYYNEIYQVAGYPTLMVSSTEGTNTEEFRNLIISKTILMTGHSGVGKSTLIKALAPDLKIKIGNISAAHLKGTHTTTFARMYMLPGDTLVIDTPGIKEFGVVDFEPWELGHWFREFKEYIPQCHYANCTHQHEPGCAVRAAAEAGKIHEERYSNYLGILNNISA